MLFSNTVSSVHASGGGGWKREERARRYRQVACNVRSFFSRLSMRLVRPSIACNGNDDDRVYMCVCVCART